MQAVQFDAVRKIVELTQRDIPEIKQENQILVKVAYAGICGTDLHVIQGEFPCKKGTVILGHEFSGTVVKVGSAVNHVKVGDNVVVDPNNGCQVCDFCHIGNPHFCETGSLQNTIGIYRDGGWAQYCLVPDSQVIKLPDNIPLEHAALCEPLSCLAHGWDKVSPLTVGQTILVTGAGIIGNLWVVALHLQGHRRVTVSEPNEFRRNQLAKLETGYDAITPDELELRKNKGIRYDVVIDCSGYGPAIENAIHLLNPGGKLCIFGVASPHTKISLSPYDVFSRELTIVGVKINPFTFPKALGLLEALGDRYLEYGKLGVKTFGLDQFEEALACLKTGVIAKAMFKL